MLFSEDLRELIFQRHNLFSADELIVISGYVGPSPIRQTRELPLNCRVIYGMFGSDGIDPKLHSLLIGLQEEISNVNIYYSKVPIHAKCYVWRRKGKIVHALVGSANFSTNGLMTPFREILAETSTDTFDPLNKYTQKVINNCISCLDVKELDTAEIQVREPPEECFLSLLGRNGEVQNAAGLNWGQNPNNHTNPNDAYIKIRVQDIKAFPSFFPPKQAMPLKPSGGRSSLRHNDAIEIIWDDGISMQGLLEGSQTVDEQVFPKQVSSFPSKSQLGEYFRQRLGVSLGQPVRKHDLDKYGRYSVAVSRIGEGIYKFDFSH